MAIANRMMAESGIARLTGNSEALDTKGTHSYEDYTSNQQFGFCTAELGFLELWTRAKG